MKALKQIKEERGIESDAAFARLLGVSQQTFTNYMKKGRVPGADRLVGWAERLQLSVEQLLLGKTNVVALKDSQTLPDLAWMLADYSEQTVIEKMMKTLLDQDVPLDERLRRANIYWQELERRVRAGTVAAKTVAGTVFGVADQRAAKGPANAKPK